MPLRSFDSSGVDDFVEMRLLSFNIEHESPDFVESSDSMFKPVYVPRKRYRFAVKSRNLDERVVISSRKRTSENPNTHHVTSIIRLFVEAIIVDKLELYKSTRNGSNETKNVHRNLFINSVSNSSTKIQTFRFHRFEQRPKETKLLYSGVPVVLISHKQRSVDSCSKCLCWLSTVSCCPKGGGEET